MSSTTKPPCCMAAAILYGAKLGLPQDEVEKWYDHYESNGWRVGRVPMKSWEAAMRNWFRNWRKFTAEKLAHHSLSTNGKTPLREKLANEDRERLNKLMREI